MKGDPKIPSLDAVVDAWVRAGCADHHERLRGQWTTARAFYQGFILQHLHAERDRRAKKGRSVYRANTPAELRAIRLTRLWLEFGAWP